jgi:hypothetical protein
MHLPTGLLAPDGRIVALNARILQVCGCTLANIPVFEDWPRQVYPDPEYGAQAEAQWRQTIGPAYLYRCSKAWQSLPEKLSCCLE